MTYRRLCFLCLCRRCRRIQRSQLLDRRDARLAHALGGQQPHRRLRSHRPAGGGAGAVGWLLRAWRRLLWVQTIVRASLQGCRNSPAIACTRRRTRVSCRYFLQCVVTIMAFEAAGGGSTAWCSEVSAVSVMWDRTCLARSARSSCLTAASSAASFAVAASSAPASFCRRMSTRCPKHNTRDSAMVEGHVQAAQGCADIWRLFFVLTLITVMGSMTSKADHSSVRGCSATMRRHWQSGSITEGD